MLLLEKLEVLQSEGFKLSVDGTSGEASEPASKRPRTEI